MGADFITNASNHYSGKLETALQLLSRVVRTVVQIVSCCVRTCSTVNVQ